MACLKFGACKSSRPASLCSIAHFSCMNGSSTCSSWIFSRIFAPNCLYVWTHNTAAIYHKVVKLGDYEFGIQIPDFTWGIIQRVHRTYQKILQKTWEYEFNHRLCTLTSRNKSSRAIVFRPHKFPATVTSLAPCSRFKSGVGENRARRISKQAAPPLPFFVFIANQCQYLE